MTHRLGALALLAFLLACGRGSLDGWIVVERGEGEAAALWREHGTERRVWLRPQRADPPWRSVHVHESPSPDAGPSALLLEGPAAAVLLHYEASRHPSFRGQLPDYRLAGLQGGGEPPVLALVTDAASLGPEPGEPDPGALARALSSAVALGAWDLLAVGDGRWLLDPGQRPWLPQFVPRAPGDWSRLRGSSLEIFLPERLASTLAARPGLRQAFYAALHERAAALPELAAALDRLAAALPEAMPRDGFEALRELLDESAEALSSYLDSVWLEQVVTLVSRDAAEIRLRVHALVPVRLEGFAAPLPRRLALFGKNAIGGLRLREEGHGRGAAPLAQRQRVILPASARTEPVALGPHRFRSTELVYRLEGLAASEALRDHLLDNLRPLAFAHDRPVDPSHVRHLAAVADPRFGAADDEDSEAFARALPERLAGEGWEWTPRALTLRAGAYELRDDLVLPDGAALRLEAGVDLRIGAGRSILVRGSLDIDGCAERPVRIRGATAEPWGVLAAQGRDVGDGSRPASRIRHLDLEGGSEDELHGAFYSGQLSVYHQDLVLEHSTLRRSHADDSLNVKYGSVEIRDALFLDSAADAVDLDHVRGRVSRVRFEDMGAGGDGLDLSGSQVEIEDAVFSGARDKCVSVGERSRVTLRGSLLRGCAIGLASKDLSRAELRDTLFLDNERDLAAYQKKAVFGGGRIHGERLVLARSVHGAESDPRSAIEIRGAWLVEAEAGDAELADARELGADAAAPLLEPWSRAEAFSAAEFRGLWSRLR